tara:strand:+ start:733 stop:3276 length:2544 start_codon:yes stop_codon:yes gene_type:complete
MNTKIFKNTNDTYFILDRINDCKQRKVNLNIKRYISDHEPYNVYKENGIFNVEWKHGENKYIAKYNISGNEISVGKEKINDEIAINTLKNLEISNNLVKKNINVSNFVRVYVVASLFFSTKVYKKFKDFNYPYKKLEFQFVHDLINEKVTSGKNLQINYIYEDRWSEFTRDKNGNKTIYLAMSDVNEDPENILQNKERFMPVTSFIETYGTPHIFLGGMSSRSCQIFREKCPQSIVFSTWSTSAVLSNDKRVIRLTMNDEHLSVMIVSWIVNEMKTIKENGKYDKFRLDVVYDKNAEWTRGYASNIINAMNDLKNNFNNKTFNDLIYPTKISELYTFNKGNNLDFAINFPETLKLEDDTFTFLLTIPDLDGANFLQKGLQPFLKKNPEFKDKSRVRLITNDILFEYDASELEDINDIRDSEIVTIAYDKKDEKYFQYLSNWYNVGKYYISRLGTALDMINTASDLTNLASGNITSQMVNFLGKLYGQGGSGQFNENSDMADKQAKFGIINTKRKNNHLWESLRSKCYEGLGEDLTLTISVVPPNTDFMLQNTDVDEVGNIIESHMNHIIKKTVGPPKNPSHRIYNPENKNGRASFFSLLINDVLPFWKKIVDAAMTNKGHKRVNVNFKIVEEIPRRDGTFQPIFIDYAQKELDRHLEPYELLRPESEFVSSGKLTGDIRICFVEHDSLADGIALLPVASVDKLGEIGSFGADITINVKNKNYSYVDGEDEKTSLTQLLAHSFGHVLGLGDKPASNSSIISIMNQSYKGPNVLGRRFRDYSLSTSLYGNNNWEVQQLRLLYSSASESMTHYSSVHVEKTMGGNIECISKYSESEDTIDHNHPQYHHEG